MTDSLTIYISKTSLSHTANVLAQASLAANTLKAYQKALAALRQKLTQVDQLKTSVLTQELHPRHQKDAMMWKTVKLGDIVLQIRNGTTAQQNIDGIGYKVSRIETISNGDIDPKRVRYVQISNNDLEKWKLKPGDILVSHINSVDHIGKSAIYTGVPEILVHGMNLLLLRSDVEKVIPTYLSYFLKSSKARNFMRSRCKKAVNQASINQRDLGALPVLIPSLEEQRRIVAKLDALLERCDILQDVTSKQMELYHALKSALLTQELQKRDVA